MFDVVGGDGASHDVAAARRELTGREAGTVRRAHSAAAPRDQPGRSCQPETCLQRGLTPTGKQQQSCRRQ
ncbi:hypothetical protein GBF38_021846, partial [Nibea albiflora]